MALGMLVSCLEATNGLRKLEDSKFQIGVKIFGVLQQKENFRSDAVLSQRLQVRQRSQQPIDWLYQTSRWSFEYRGSGKPLIYLDIRSFIAKS